MVILIRFWDFQPLSMWGFSSAGIWSYLIFALFQSKSTPTAQPIAWRGGSKKEKTLIFHAKAVLGVKYGGQIFFGQNPGESQNHRLLKAVMAEKRKACINTFTKKLVTTSQLSRTRSGHFFLKYAKLEKHIMLKNSHVWLVVTWSTDFESMLMPRSVCKWVIGIEAWKSYNQST